MQRSSETVTKDMVCTGTLLLLDSSMRISVLATAADSKRLISRDHTH